MKKTVVVTLLIQGVHNWPECPFNDVSFLKGEHRHVFHIKAKKEVSHLDRDIEIILLKNSILNWMKEKYESRKYGVEILNFGDMSCEMIAEKLMDQFQLYTCQVLEDGENGAELIDE